MPLAKEIFQILPLGAEGEIIVVNSDTAFGRYEFSFHAKWLPI
jgi:hypothetical protein